MKNYKVIALTAVLSFSFLAKANESEAVVVEVSMENVLEVGRENQKLSAANIDACLFLLARKSCSL